MSVRALVRALCAMWVRVLHPASIQYPPYDYDGRGLAHSALCNLGLGLRKPTSGCARRCSLLGERRPPLQNWAFLLKFFACGGQQAHLGEVCIGHWFGCAHLRASVVLVLVTLA